jgi:hypothetical protein
LFHFLLYKTFFHLIEKQKILGRGFPYWFGQKNLIYVQTLSWNFPRLRNWSFTLMKTIQKCDTPTLLLTKNFWSKVLVSQQFLPHSFFITKLENTFTQ